MSNNSNNNSGPSPQMIAAGLLAGAGALYGAYRLFKSEEPNPAQAQEFAHSRQLSASPDMAYPTQIPQIGRFNRTEESVERTCDRLGGLTLNTNSAGASRSKKPAVIAWDEDGPDSEYPYILPENPVGYLEEFCNKKYKNGPEDFPVYHCYIRDNVAGWTAMCIFEGFKVYVTSIDSEQIAKRRVAMKMVKTLMNAKYFDKFRVEFELKERSGNQFVGQPADPYTRLSSNSPISVVYEHCAKKHWRCPEFTFDITGGKPSAPTEFTCHCTVENGVGEKWTCDGVGSSQQYAKTDAFRNMCRRLGLKFQGDDIYEIEKIESTVDIDKNAKSALQEFCDAHKELYSKGQTYPQYGSKPPVNNFCVERCNVGVVSEDGKHPTKQGAQKIAAKKVLIKLRELVKK